jgi:hypothetical protein
LNIYPDVFEFSTKHDFFAKDVQKGAFKQSKLKKQTEADKTYYSGHLKLDHLVENKIQHLNEGRILVLKPNYFPCSFERMITDDKCLVNIFEKKYKVDIEDIILA